MSEAGIDVEETGTFQFLSETAETIRSLRDKLTEVTVERDLLKLALRLTDGELDTLRADFRRIAERL